MSSDAQPHNPESAVRLACDTAGLDSSGATLLHHYSNAIYLLPNERAVARVTVGTGAEPRVRLAQRITEWLVTEHRFPATQPLPGTAPVAVNTTCVVSFWIYYPAPQLHRPADVARPDRATVPAPSSR